MRKIVFALALALPLSWSLVASAQQPAPQPAPQDAKAKVETKEGPSKDAKKIKKMENTKGEEKTTGGTETKK